MPLRELERLAKTEKSSRTRIRYLAACLFVEGKSRADIARYLKVARGSVNKWIKNYLDNGTDGLTDAIHHGRPSQLSIQQLEQLKKFIESSSSSDKGGRLQARDVHQFIVERFDIDYRPSNIYRLLHHLNFSWITSRSRHPKHNEKAQTFFKNLPTGNDP